MRLKVTSRKLTTFLLASIVIVILRLCRYVRCQRECFLAVLVCNSVWFVHFSLEFGMFFRRSYNPRHISCDIWDVFYPPNVGLCELASQGAKNSTLGGKEHNNLSPMRFLHRVSQRIVTRIVVLQHLAIRPFPF